MVYKSIIVLVVTLLMSISANAKSIKDNIIYQDDVINIQSCDQFGWCKVKDENLYVRKFHFRSLDGVQYIMTEKEPSYYYVKTNKKDSYFHGYERYIVEKKSLAKSLIVQSNITETTFEDDKTISKDTSKISLLEKLDRDKLFLVLTTGYSKIEISTTLNSGALSSGALDDSGLNFDIGLGYRYNSDIFTTANISRTILDIVDFTNFYLTINRQYNDKPYKPYIGAIVGYSEIVYTHDLLKTTTSKSSKGGRFFSGIQAGITKKLKDKTNLIVQYQLLKYDHKSNINSNDNLQHKWQNNLMIGVRYDF